MPPAILVLVAFLMQHSIICTAFAPPRASITSIGSANANVNVNANVYTPLTTCTVKANNDADEIASASASASAPPRKTVTEISPLKASMLTKSWQSLLDEVDQKVGIVPELGSTSVGVQRFGPELERRTLCKRQFQFLQASTFGLALADKNVGLDVEKKEALRKAVPGLEGRGVGCKVFACLTAPATMSLVECNCDSTSAERGNIYWNVMALIVNPTERSLPIIIDCERAALDELRTLAGEVQAVVRTDATVMNSLAGSHTYLAIVPDTSTVEESESGGESKLQWLISVTEE
jgi:hypothetical protein